MVAPRVKNPWGLWPPQWPASVIAPTAQERWIISQVWNGKLSGEVWFLTQNAPTLFRFLAPPRPAGNLQCSLDPHSLILRAGPEDGRRSGKKGEGERKGREMGRGGRGRKRFVRWQFEDWWRKEWEKRRFERKGTGEGMFQFFRSTLTLTHNRSPSLSVLSLVCELIVRNCSATEWCSRPTVNVPFNTVY